MCQQSMETMDATNELSIVNQDINYIFRAVFCYRVVFKCKPKPSYFKPLHSLFATTCSPGVGVAIFMAGVPIGVLPGVSSGVDDPIWLAGVSSQRDFLLLAPGVGVSPTDSSRSVRGVSAQPLPCPGVSRSVLGVSSQRFFRTLPVAPPWPGVACPGVSLPGVAAPAGVWLGVGSHMRVLGVAPGVSLPFGRPGVSSHRLFEGVCAGV